MVTMTKEEENKLAESHGFSCIKDDKRGYGWSKFNRNSLWVWHITHGWMTARLHNGVYSSHHSYETLEEALRRVI